VIEINARATAVALRPTAVSEGQPANQHVVHGSGCSIGGGG